jgi:Fe-S-cluster containining protein
MVSTKSNFFQICGACKVGCCRNARPPITGRRKRRIDAYLAAHGVSLDHPFERGAYTFPRETREGVCVFLEENSRRCRIHPVKPETCVAGPITFDINLHTGKVEWYLKSESICPLAGVLYHDKSALETHLNHAKQVLQTLIHELRPAELFALLQIDEPDTFKIGEDPLSQKLLGQQHQLHATHRGAYRS